MLLRISITVLSLGFLANILFSISIGLILLVSISCLSQILKLFNTEYLILDALEYITLADSFLKNKIGTGHGEAKLYVGNESKNLSDFFGDFAVDCFFNKKDLFTFLKDSESEYKNPQQPYINKNMLEHFNDCINQLNNFSDNLLHFKLYRVNVVPPRVYINSSSKYYAFMRKIGLPTYLIRLY